MPRTARKKSSTNFYHVVGKGINHEFIFNQNREKNNFKRLLAKYLEKYGVKIYAYVVMTTHFHLLIYADLKVLSGYMAIVLAEFAEYYNYKHNRNGHVFQNRFHSECIEDSKYFWNCLRYIHMNPVQASIVNNPLVYRFSSINEYEKEKNKIIDPEAIKLYKDNFQDFEEFIQFHDRTSKSIVLDIPDEIEIQREKAAMSILKQEARLAGATDHREVLENIDLRTKYKEILRKELKISKSKTEQLYQYVKRCIIEE